MSSSAPIADAITVVFAYEEAKGCFVDTPGWKPGGAPIAIYTLATELAKDHSFDVRVLVHGSVPAERVEGVRLVSRPLPIQRGVPGLSRILNRERARRPFRGHRRLVVITTVSQTGRLPALQSAVHAVDGKIIYRIASDLDVRPEDRGDDGGDPFTRALLKCDALVAQTERQVTELRSRFGHEATLIPPSFRIPPEAPLPEKDSVLWVGQSYAVKRPWVFLELARAYPAERFIMVFPAVQQDIWDAVMESARHVPNLHVVESIPPSEIQPYYDRAKVLVNTSQIEGFPNTFHQAAIARTPVLSLSWNAGGYLDTFELGMCADGDVDTMIRQLGQMLTDPALRERMGANARRQVEARNDVSVAIESYKQLIRAIALGNG